MKSWYISVLAVIIVALVGGVLPTWKSNTILQQELNTLTADLSDRVAELQALETEGEEERQKQKEITQRIPVTLDQAEVLRDIYQITQANGFAFDGIQFRMGTGSDSGARELYAQFQAQGQGTRVVNFLTAIERNSPFFGLSSLQVNRDPLDGSVNLAVELYTYSLQ